jgi:hypothetical protein
MIQMFTVTNDGLILLTMIRIIKMLRVMLLPMLMVENKMMTMKEAQIILSLFLYEPAGSNGRGMAESRLASAQYNKGDK